MGEEGVTFFQPFGNAKVNAPTLTGSVGCSARAAAAKIKKTAAENAVLIRKTIRNLAKQEKKSGRCASAPFRQELVVGQFERKIQRLTQDCGRANPVPSPDFVGAGFGN
jgi:hypothetical protein